ncbi:MAG: penicillin-binding protein [Actinomycetia bacterium]|nr:penicillin-binding protein [Actinomycetes bacterium]
MASGKRASHDPKAPTAPPRRAAHGARTAAPATTRAASPTTTGASSTTTKRATSTAPKRGTSGKKRTKKRTVGQLIGQIAIWAGIVIASLVLIGIALIAWFYAQTNLPDPNKAFTTQTTTLYYRDGTTVLGTLAVQNRQPLTSAEMPKVMQDAMLGAEDRTFWTNPGVSLPGMVRAGMRVATGGDLQSGSTLTQQYIKVLYLTSEQTMSRKAKEVVLAIKMTNQMPKQQILTDYLNTVYFGRGAYGAQAAAQAFFATDAKNLTTAQAAVLAAVVNSPANLDPANPSNLPALTARYNYVLDGMVAMQTLPAEDAAALKNHLPDFPAIPVSNQYGGTKGFLITMATKELANAGLTQAQIDGGGLKITTTFDATLQAGMDQTVAQYTAQAAAGAKTAQDPNNLHIGMASVRVGTGEVLAAHGGPDYVASQMNWATTPRATASTFKPYAFIAGERAGFSLTSVFNGSAFTPKDGKPLKNAGNANYGRVTLLKATEESINTAYVDLVQQLPDGSDAVVQAATDAGLKPNDSWISGPRIPLGESEASPLDQAGAYATFANGGNRATTHCVIKATDPSGATVYTGDTSVRATIEPDITSDLNTALQSVVDSGTATAAKALGTPTAGKTGTFTADDGTTRGVWFVGYTTAVSTAVSIVAGNGYEPLEPFAPPGGVFTSGGYPVKTWLGFMKTAVQAYPGTTFPPAAHVNASPTATPSAEPTPSEPATTAPETTEPTTEAPTTTAPTTTAPPPPTTSQPPVPPTTTTHTTAPTTGAAPSTGPPESPVPPAPGTPEPAAANS